MDILMNQLRMRLVWKENDESDPSVTSDYVPTGDTFNTTTFADWNTGERNLCIKVLAQKAVYPTNADPYYEYTMLDDSVIANYSINEGGTDGMGIGSTIAASFTLTIDNSAHTYKPSDFTNTRFAVAIGITIEGHTGIDYEPLGVWSVTDVDAAEQSAVITIQGMDMLGFYYDDTFWPFTGDDAAIEIDYGSISGMMDAITQVWSDIPWGLNIDDNGNVIADPTDYPLFDWKRKYTNTYSTSTLNLTVPQRLYIAASKSGLTRRQVISWVATMIGAFVRMDRSGSLLLVNYRYSSTYSVDSVYPSTYYTYTPDGVETYAPLYGVYWYFTDDTMEKTDSVVAVEDNAELKPSNAIEIGANPMLTSTTAAAISIPLKYYLTRGTRFPSLTLSFVGTPLTVEGEGFKVFNLSSTSQYQYVICLPTRISATYDGGFSMTVESKFPSDNTAYSSSFNSSTTLLTYTKELAYGRANQAAYSTDEQVTGQRWIDGKPIYRKVYTGTTSSTGAVTVGESPASIGTVVSCQGCYQRNGVWRAFPYCSYANLNWSVSVTVGTDSGIIQILFGSSNTGSKDYYIILEYTKTTD